MKNKALPSGWTETELINLVASDKNSIRRGPFGGAIKKEIFVEAGYKVYEQKNAIYDNFELGHYFIDEPKYRELIGFAVHSGDFLISCSGTIGKIAIVPNDAKPGIINQALMKITPDTSKVDPVFFKRLLETKQVQRQMFGTAAGSAIKNIKPLKIIKKTQLFIPPLEEQRRIAAILDKGDELRQKRCRALARLDDLLQSVFLEMFGDPVTNPMGWEEVQTIDVCNCIVPGRDKPKSFTGDIPWITTNDLVHLGITTTSKINQGLRVEEIEKVRGKIIPKGSVVITCVGDLGITSVAGKDFVMNQQLHSFQCSAKVNNRFLEFSLSFQKPYMYRRATSTTVPYMNKSVCNSIPTILPPIELQNQFASIVEKIDYERVIFDRHLEKLDALFGSLQQRAFG